MKRFKDILCAVEPGKACKPAIERAVTLAENNQAGLMIVDVAPRVTAGIGMPEGGPISADLQAAEENLDQLINKTIRNLGKQASSYLEPKTHLLKGSARKEIPALAKRIEADLVVIGTVARTGVSGFIMGNTAETILNQIDCSVLAIKPPGFKTPVAQQG